MKTKEQEQVMDQAKKMANKVKVKETNEMLEGTSIGDFKISKRVLENIAEWCLNGDTEFEIRQKLELNKNQWAILISACPDVLKIMEFGYAYADMVVGGSLLQVAIGGKKIKKQQLVKVGDYENGVKVGEHIEKVEIEEELPPNPLLLKFLAENRFTEKFSERNGDDKVYRGVIDNLTDEDRKKLERAKKVYEIANGNENA